MEYYISKKLNCFFDEAVLKVTELLKVEGFGVLTEINLHESTVFSGHAILPLLIKLCKAKIKLAQCFPAM